MIERRVYETWEETTGHDFVPNLTEEKKLDLAKLEIKEESEQQKRYDKVWQSLDEKTKLKIKKEIEKISKTRPFGYMPLTKHIIKCEILDRYK